MLKKIIIFILILNFTYHLSAAENKVVTYSDCVQIALENNPQIKYMQETEKIYLSSLKKAESSKTVQIDGSVSTSKGDVSGSEAIGSMALTAGIGITYGIFIPGRDTAIDLSKDAIYLNKLTGKIKLNEIIFEVKQSYFNYIKAMNNAMLRKTILDKYSLVYRKNTIYFEAGNLRPYVYNTIEIQYNQLRLEYEIAVQDEKNARSALFLSMGISEPETEFVIDTNLTLPVFNLTYEQLERISIILSPEISIAKMKREMARKTITSAREKRLPTVSTNAFAGFENGNAVDPYNTEDLSTRMEVNNWSPVFGITFSLAIPIYRGGAINSEIEKSISQYNQSVYDEKSVILKVNQSLLTNFEKLKFLKRQIEISEKTLLNSKKNFELIEKSYNAGIADITDINTANENLLQVETQNFSLKIDYLMTVTKIAHIIGISEEELCSK
ncbi:MAG: TolC family protein [Spirochaetes bacterium]|nr:TolC family protein [Spirochaetota bacterium]